MCLQKERDGVYLFVGMKQHRTAYTQAALWASVFRLAMVGSWEPLKSFG